jgi:acyl carrier protein
MNRSKVQEIVAGSIGNVLGRPVSVGECISRETEPRWDSLSHAMIMFSVEDAFGVKFTEEELQKLKTSDEVVDTVIRHLEPLDQSCRTRL